MSLYKGEQTEVTVALSKPNEIIPSAPTWTLYDWEDEALLTGVAVQKNANKWAASFTIPTTLEVPDGAQDVILRFDAVTNTGREISTDKVLTLVDAFDTEQQYGLLWMPGSGAITDRVVFSREPTTITASIREGYGDGTELYSTTISDPEKVADIEDGAVYDIEFTPPATIVKAVSGGAHAYQILIKAEYASGPPDLLVKPFFALTPAVTSRLMALKRFLNKGQFKNVFPTLDWADEELVHYLNEGLGYINSIPEFTYYNLDSMPNPLESTLQIAAAWIALNALYLAEGFSDFDFQGSSLSLSVDRKQVIQTKMDELKSVLDAQLPNQKKNAVRVFGPGTPTSGLLPNRSSIGALGLTLNNVNNWPIRGYPMINGRFI